MPRSADQTRGRVKVASASGDLSGDCEAAWSSLWHQHYHQVYRLAARYGVEPSEVEDVTQKTFVVAYRRIGEVGEIRNPLAWLLGITVRVASQHRRWRRVRRAKQWLLPESPAVRTEPVITPEHSVVAAEEIQDVRHVLEQLAPKLRAALVLCDIEERKPKEVAEILEIPVNTVRSRRRLAKETFRRLWEDTH